MIDRDQINKITKALEKRDELLSPMEWGVKGVAYKYGGRASIVWRFEDEDTWPQLLKEILEDHSIRVKEFFASELRRVRTEMDQRLSECGVDLGGENATD
jgi:hypothetical protein